MRGARSPVMHWDDDTRVGPGVSLLCGGRVLPGEGSYLYSSRAEHEPGAVTCVRCLIAAERLQGARLPGSLTLCERCYPPRLAQVEEHTIGVLRGACDVCHWQGSSPELRRYRLADLLRRLCELERSRPS